MSKPRKKMGRPVELPPTAKRRVIFLADETWEDVRLASQKQDRSRAYWIRQAISEKLGREGG